MLGERGMVVVAGGLAAALFVGSMTGCSSYSMAGGTTNLAQHYAARSGEAIQMFLDADPSLQRYFDEAHGYAVFPQVTKGALGIGAAHGEGGIVYERGRITGISEVTQITLGFQIGGHGFAEIIFFQDKTALEDFKRGQARFSANAAAAVARSGAGAASDFSKGAAVFILSHGGLMLEAAIGGQKFSYRPIRPNELLAEAPQE